jgi:hypothetical protein
MVIIHVFVGTTRRTTTATATTAAIIVTTIGGNRAITSDPRAAGNSITRRLHNFV